MSNSTSILTPRAGLSLDQVEGDENEFFYRIPVFQFRLVSRVRHAHALCYSLSMLVPLSTDQLSLDAAPCSGLPSILQTCKPTEVPLHSISHRTANTVSLANNVGAMVLSFWSFATHLIVARSHVDLLSPSVFCVVLRYVCFLEPVPWPSPSPGPAYAPLHYLRARSHNTSCRS